LGAHEDVFLAFEFTLFEGLGDEHFKWVIMELMVGGSNSSNCQLRQYTKTVIRHHISGGISLNCLMLLLLLIYNIYLNYKVNYWICTIT